MYIPQIFNVVSGGIPRGSVLGALLFLIYNDLPGIIFNKSFSFADDTTFLVKCENKSDLVRNTLKPY